MHGLAVRQKNDPQIPSTHRLNWRPTANSPILLNDLPDRVVYNVLNPLVTNYSTVRTAP